MRKKLTKKGSKKLFKATAMQTKPINLKSEPARGGFRL